MKNQNWIGIIGNTGPEADEILQRYLRLEMQRRGAKNDQDHLPLFVIKNPNITDRTAAIFHSAPSPSAGILETCNLLQRNGIYFAGLPSNTSHYFYDDFQSKTDVYIIHLLHITSEYVQKTGVSRIGVLCTTPTKKTGIYTKSFQKFGIEDVYPDERSQDVLQNAIYGTLPEGAAHNERLPDGLKSGNRIDSFEKVAHAVKILREEKHCSHILLGCTELPCLSEELEKAFPDIIFIDPMRILALRMIEIKEIIDRKMNANEPGKPVKVTDITSAENAADYVVYQYRHGV